MTLYNSVYYTMNIEGETIAFKLTTIHKQIKLQNMFTLSIMPNFTGTRKDYLIGFMICLSLDSITCLPLIF